jgi:hypothetical protein
MRDGLSGIAIEPVLIEGFQVESRAMHMQREKSVKALNYQKGKGRVFGADKLGWRAFQLACTLLNLWES